MVGNGSDSVELPGCLLRFGGHKTLAHFQSHGTLEHISLQIIFLLKLDMLV